MKKPTFLGGLALAALLVFTAVILNDRHPGAVDNGTLLLPQLGDALNDVSRVRIQGQADDQVTLQRVEAGWQVGERSYPADVGKIRELLINLSEATVLEEKTRNPALYERLGVQDYGTGETDNKQILIWAGDDQIAGLVLGKTASQPRGSYVRLIAGEASALADRVLVASADPTQWLAKALINVSPDDVTRVDVAPAESPDYSLRREDDSWSLDALSDGEQAKGANLARVGRVLQNLRLEDVLPPDATLPTAGWTQARYALADGSVVTVEAVEQDGRKLARLTIEAGDDADEALRKAAERVAGRVFEIQGYKFNDVTLKRELLIETDDAA